MASSIRAERRHVEAWLDADPAVRDRLSALAQSTDLVRSAYADIVNEPVPERLLAAARGESTNGLPRPLAPAEIVVLPPRRAAGPRPGRRRYIGLAAAAALFGIMIGGAGTYVGMGLLPRDTGAEQTQLAAAAAQRIWLDNAAGLVQAGGKCRGRHAGRCPGQQRPARGAAAYQPERAAECGFPI